MLYSEDNDALLPVLLIYGAYKNTSRHTTQYIQIDRQTDTQTYSVI